MDNPLSSLSSMLNQLLINIKCRFFDLSDSKVKRFFVWLYGVWMELYLPVQVWVLYHILHRRIDHNHAVVLERLRTQKRIRVLFLIKENAKWGWDSLYQAFEKDPLFEPLVAVIFFGLPKSPDAEQKSSFDANYSFFKSRGMRVVKAYDEEKDEFVDLRKFDPDIVFYEPPWHLSKIQDVPEVSKFALTCHTPYGLNLAKNSAQYRLPFIQLVWRDFVECELSKEYMTRYSLCKGRNLVSVGYPKLDCFLKESVLDDERWPSSQIKRSAVRRIIYAPHWSFSFLRYATMEWCGEFLLQYASEHPETEWVFKPHPRLSHTLRSELSWTEKDVSSYFDRWRTLPNAVFVDDGDYVDLFFTSDVLLTDSVSFLGEYLYTKKPIIHLTRRDSIGFNLVGEKLVKHYYNADNLESLRDILDRVVLRSDDFMKQERLSALSVIPLVSGGAGCGVKNYLKRVIKYGE